MELLPQGTDTHGPPQGVETASADQLPPGAAAPRSVGDHVDQALGWVGARFQAALRTAETLVSTPHPQGEARSCPAERLLDEEKGALGDTIRLCTAIPASPYQRSNQESARKVLYLNAPGSNAEHFVEDLQALANWHGQPVEGIVTTTTSLLPLQHLASLAGKLSSDLGALAVPEAVQNLIRITRGALDRKERIKIACSAEASTVVANGLSLLARERALSTWGADVKLIDVTTFAGSAHGWPPDLKVKVYDFRPPTRNLLGKIGTELRSHLPLPAPSLSAERVTVEAPVSPEGHRLSEYLRYMPRFIEGSFRDAQGRVDGERLARFFIDSVRAGSASDLVHHQIATRACEERYRQFAKTILTEYPDGAIGKFQMRRMDELRALATSG